jgi:hypothetical protein
MTLFQNLKFRSAKLFSAFAAVMVLGTAGGYAAHVYAAEDCCYPGAACCHPGAACCAAHHKAQQN